MSSINTFILLPFLGAFLLSIARFYVRDRAHSIFMPSFILAVSAVIVALIYLVLGMLYLLPAHAAIGVGVLGAVFLVVSVYQLTQL